MMLKFTILGCGSSGGVPRPALGWGVCDPNNPKNRRRRTSLLVERRGSGGGLTRVLIDTSPDLREQLLDAQVDWLDGVLYTHEHADHTHGVDDLRALFLHRRRKVDVYLDAPTSEVMRLRFGYCFETPPGSQYPPILAEHRLTPGEAVSIAGAGGAIAALPIRQEHGDIDFDRRLHLVGQAPPTTHQQASQERNVALSRSMYDVLIPVPSRSPTAPGDRLGRPQTTRRVTSTRRRPLCCLITWPSSSPGASGTQAVPAVRSAPGRGTPE